MTIAEKILAWTYVAHYPGPNENEHFQAGYMECVHKMQGIVQRLIKEEEKNDNQSAR